MKGSLRKCSLWRKFPPENVPSKVSSLGKSSLFSFQQSRSSISISSYPCHCSSLPVISDSLVALMKLSIWIDISSLFLTHRIPFHFLNVLVYSRGIYMIMALQLHPIDRCGVVYLILSSVCLQIDKAVVVRISKFLHIHFPAGQPIYWRSQYSYELNKCIFNRLILIICHVLRRVI